MAKKLAQQLELYSVERDFIEHLKSELTFWRTEYQFLKGKCERLELATFKHGNEIARDYAARTPIVEVVADAPKEPVKKTWTQVKAEWETMTDEQKEQAIAKGAN